MEISKVLGKWISLDSKRARFQVSVNVDMPLQFERRIEFPNDDIGRVSFSYEGLFRYCYTCHMISHDESACPELTPEERELKRQQRIELNAKEDPLSVSTRQDARSLITKRPRSPPTGRLSPPIGRHQLPPSHHPRSYRKEEKRQKLSPSRDSRGHGYNQNVSSNARENTNYNLPRKEDVWKRLDLPHRTSSAYGKTYPSHAPHRESSRSQRSGETYQGRHPPRYQSNRTLRPRSPRRSTHYSDTAPVSSSAPLPEQQAPSRAISDSQRTISDQLGNLVLGDTNRGDQERNQISQRAETEEERTRRIKGKAHISDTPTSRERAPRLRSTSLSIREPVDAPNAPQANNSPRATEPTPAPAPTSKVPRNLDMELDDFVQELDITLTEEDIAMVDKMVKETELLEMDADMMDNDDLLDELPDDSEEKIDAISQLSPATAEATKELETEFELDFPEEPMTMQTLNSLGLARETNAANTSDTAQTKAQRVPLPPSTAKGYLKKHAPKNPEVKGAKASKKLSQARGRNSPRKRATPGIPPTVSTVSSTVPRNEVFPSAKSKKSLSLSGSVVSQKPPSKKI
ncbi:Uncharacterized protein Rs2_38030 [Raphanus sativus]|nr:Uncharacterized protein Rs2_38030 [Raphanus sativus]